MIRVAGNELTHANLKMVLADEAHIHELSDDDIPRNNRDRSATAMRELLVGLRSGFVGLFGSELAGSVGFSGNTPYDAVLLSQFATTILNNLGTRVLPVSRLPGFQYDVADWITSIEPLRDRLVRDIAAVSLESREAEACLLAKNEAIEEFDRVWPRVCNLLSALFEIAGETELASRVRPTIPEGGSVEEPDAPTETPALPTNQIEG